MIRPNFQDDHQPSIARYCGLLLAIQAAESPALARQEGVAARKNRQVFEGAEIHAHVHAPVACLPQSRLNVLAAKMDEISTIH